MSYEDVEKLRNLAVINNARIPHFMQDQERYLQHLDHIVAVNKVDDSTLQQLLPAPPEAGGGGARGLDGHAGS